MDEGNTVCTNNRLSPQTRRGAHSVPPTGLCEPQQSLPCVKGGGEPASRRDCFKSKVTYPQTRVHGVPPYEFVRRARSFEVMPKASLLLTARTAARSAPLRGLAMFHSGAVAINQSKRLRTHYECIPIKPSPVGEGGCEQLK